MQYALFFTVFLLVYAGMHALVFWGLFPLLARHGAVPGIAVAWMVLMIAAPFAVRLLERQGYDAAARAAAWVTYSWLGFLFLAFCLFALAGAAQLALHLGGFFHAPLADVQVRTAAASAAVLLAAAAVGLYGFHEARRLTVERVEIATEKLGGSAARVRIVQVSDIHVGLLNREDVLAPIVERVRELAPDIFVATGDIVDAQINHLEELIAPFRSLKPPLGMFAVTGNHERYAGLEQSIDYLEKSGFTVLRDRAVTPGGAVTLVGVDDRDGGGDESPLLAASNSPFFTVLLKHRPQANAASAGLLDLQLSGHTHRGQIYPFRHLTGLAFPMNDGLYDLPGWGRLYASRGTGTWGPPMRVLTPPEITVIDLVRK